MNDEINTPDNYTASSPSEAASQLQTEVIKSLQEKLDCYTRAAVDRYQKIEQATRQRVIEKPGASIAVVAAVSLVLGIVIGKSRSASV